MTSTTSGVKVLVDTLSFHVIVDPELPKQVKGVVAIGDFEPVEGDDIGVVYPDPNIARRIFGDLILGRPLPLVVAIREVRTISQLVAITIFLHRELAIHESTPGLIAAAELVDDLGPVVGAAHVNADLGRLFGLIPKYLESEKPGTAEFKERLTTAVGWVRDLVVEGRFPALPAPCGELPRVLDHGTNGFVLAEMGANSTPPETWTELFRQGFLRGVVFSSLGRGRWAILALKKSLYVPMNFHRAAAILNEAESAMGEPPLWRATDFSLEGPPEGTLLLLSAILGVLQRA